MTHGIDGVITACPAPPDAKRSAGGALLTSTWGGVHDQQEQEDGKDAHEGTFPWYND